MNQDVDGKVTDEKGQPLPNVNVVLLAPDSTFVQGAVTDEQGEFKIISSEDGSLLKLTSISYETRFIPLTPSTSSLLTIQMKEETEMLDEVVVKSQLPKTLVKGDAIRQGIAIRSHHAAVGIQLERAVTGVGRSAIGQSDAEEPLALDAHIRGIVRSLQRPLGEDTLGGSHPGAQANLLARGILGIRTGSCPCLTDSLIKQILELSPYLLAAIVIDIGDIVGNNIHICLLGDHA